jgi:glucose-1-phosphate adenylyltransferase
MILAGGQGERLYPLTKDRAKPAVPFGGAYRIVDFTLSNCLNSGVFRIFLLTQYRSLSLHRHVFMGWSVYFNPALGQFIDIVPPQQRTASMMWYRGTADAIYQNIYLLEQERPEWVIVLSGDHIYKMDYGAMLQAHLTTGAVLTVACIEVERAEARRFGVMEVDADNRILAFEEKPPSPKPVPGKPDTSLASMGIYVFETRALVKALIEDARSDSVHDFGKNIIPALVGEGERVFAYPFRDPADKGRPYWRDIGTLDSYYAANTDLLAPTLAFDLYGREWPIRTHQVPLPPARTATADGHRPDVQDSLLCPGCLVRGASVERSILSGGVVLEPGASVQGSLLLNDVHVGEGARVVNAIVDKDVRIPPGDCIGGDPERDRRRFTTTDNGVAVIPKGMILS